jgi:hypothetical protein
MAVQNLKNMTVVLNFLVELTEEQSTAFEAIYLEQGKELIHLALWSMWHSYIVALFN